MACKCDMHGRGKAAHCRSCCVTFSGPWAFDQHIRLSEAGAHRSPEASGLVEVRAGVWGAPDSGMAGRPGAS